jgi:hypothetical protein
MSQHRRLEVLLTAAFIEWAQDITHEKAVEVAEAQRTPWIFRAVALNVIAFFSDSERDENTPLVLVEPSEPKPKASPSLRVLMRKAAGL